jgi:hypothetical protein
MGKVPVFNPLTNEGDLEIDSPVCFVGIVKNDYHAEHNKKKIHHEDPEKEEALPHISLPDHVLPDDAGCRGNAPGYAKDNEGEQQIDEEQGQTEIK